MDTSPPISPREAAFAYDPNRLLDTLIEHLGLASDEGLAKRLDIEKSIIDDLRSGRKKISGSMLLWMQEASGMSTSTLKESLGDRRSQCRPICR